MRMQSPPGALTMSTSPEPYAKGTAFLAIDEVPQCICISQDASIRGLSIRILADSLVKP